MTDDIVGLIDGAIEDWTPSVDAMRWRSPEAEEPAPPTPTCTLFMINGINEAQPATMSEVRQWMSVRLRAITDTYVQALVRVREAAEPTFVRCVQAVREAAENLERARDPAPATRRPASLWVPAYRDDRLRWQSPYGPRGRR